MSEGGSWRPDPVDDGPQPVGASLDRLARSIGMAGPGPLRGVFGRWAEVVGEQVAAHARPVSLRDGTLVVAVDQPGWATQLRFLETDLVRRLAEVAGDGVVARVEVRVRPRR